MEPRSSSSRGPYFSFPPLLRLSLLGVLFVLFPGKIAFASMSGCNTLNFNAVKDKLSLGTRAGDLGEAIFRFVGKEFYPKGKRSPKKFTYEDKFRLCIEEDVVAFSSWADADRNSAADELGKIEEAAKNFLKDAQYENDKKFGTSAEAKSVLTVMMRHVAELQRTIENRIGSSGVGQSSTLGGASGAARPGVTPGAYPVSSSSGQESVSVTSSMPAPSFGADGSQTAAAPKFDIAKLSFSSKNALSSPATSLITALTRFLQAMNGHSANILRIFDGVSSEVCEKLMFHVEIFNGEKISFASSRLVTDSAVVAAAEALKKESQAFLDKLVSFQAGMWSIKEDERLVLEGMRSEIQRALEKLEREQAEGMQAHAETQALLREQERLKADQAALQVRMAGHEQESQDLFRELDAAMQDNPGSVSSIGRSGTSGRGSAGRGASSDSGWDTVGMSSGRINVGRGSGRGRPDTSGSMQYPSRPPVLAAPAAEQGVPTVSGVGRAGIVSDSGFGQQDEDLSASGISWGSCLEAEELRGDTTTQKPVYRGLDGKPLDAVSQRMLAAAAARSAAASSSCSDVGGAAPPAASSASKSDDVLSGLLSAEPAGFSLDHRRRPAADRVESAESPRCRLQDHQSPSSQTDSVETPTTFSQSATPTRSFLADSRADRHRLQQVEADFRELRGKAEADFRELRGKVEADFRDQKGKAEADFRDPKGGTRRGRWERLFETRKSRRSMIFARSSRRRRRTRTSDGRLRKRETLKWRPQ